MKKLFLLSLMFMLAVSVAAQETNVMTDSVASKELVYTVVEQMPEFPNGQQALFRYLNDSIKYPIVAKQKGIQGRALCRFVVEKDGSVSNIEVFRSTGDVSLDQEAIRLIISMPKWTPGIQRGRTVRVLFTVPVNFKLDN